MLVCLHFAMRIALEVNPSSCNDVVSALNVDLKRYNIANVDIS